ncbi:hypothetical protein KQX54_015505 [Cotesia glomerata]|uniref:Uncharacterized protein n=1 Tax=Cotesia glomerata TaxID=32391 RepID=A0AAV7HU65_COTGL|nr:hypothetical protein KQX54_015505 [Cotesia glomerata]
MVIVRKDFATECYEDAPKPSRRQMRRAHFRDPATSMVPSPAEEGWQEEARALPSPEPRPMVVPSPPALEGIPEPLYIEKRLRARRDNLKNQTVSKKKKKKRRGPRQLLMEDYEGGVPRSPERLWDEAVLEIDEGLLFS